MNSLSKRSARIAVGALFILALAWQQIEATRLGYAVEKSRKQEHILRGRIGALQMELETSLSPAQLAQAARGRLGMMPAAPESLRILGENAGDAAPKNFLSRLFSSWSLRKQGLDT
jgi:hypothetical protein